MINMSIRRVDNLGKEWSIMTLKQARKDANMTQVQLAAAADVSLTTIQRIENGKLQETSVGTITRLCNALGITISSFFAETD
jgi:transcriptional regulator with XRE-family HTH domain